MRNYTDTEIDMILDVLSDNPIINSKTLEGKLPWLKERGKTASKNILSRYKRILSGEVCRDDFDKCGHVRDNILIIRSKAQKRGWSLGPLKSFSYASFRPRLNQSKNNYYDFMRYSCYLVSVDLREFLREDDIFRIDDRKPLPVDEVIEIIESVGYQKVGPGMYGVDNPHGKRMPVHIMFASGKQPNRPKGSIRIGIPNSYTKYNESRANYVRDSIKNSLDFSMEMDGAFVITPFIRYKEHSSLTKSIRLAHHFNMIFWGSKS